MEGPITSVASIWSVSCFMNSRALCLLGMGLNAQVAYPSY